MYTQPPHGPSGSSAPSSAGNRMASKKHSSPSARRVAVPPQETSRSVSRPKMADTTGDEVGAAEMNRRVSEALKRWRKVRDLSLDQLAVKSGVSRAALSQ